MMKLFKCSIFALCISLALSSCFSGESNSSNGKGTVIKGFNKAKLQKPKKNTAESDGDEDGGNLDQEAIFEEFISTFKTCTDANDFTDLEPIVDDMMSNVDNLCVENKANLVAGLFFCSQSRNDNELFENEIPEDQLTQEQKNYLERTWQLEINMIEVNDKAKNEDGYNESLAQIEEAIGVDQGFFAGQIEEICASVGQNGGGCDGGDGNDDSYNDGGSSSIVECTDNSFASQVISNGQIKCQTPFIIDFNATWCGPCQQLRPILEKIQGQYGSKIQIFSVDVDQCPNASEEFGVESLPTIMFFNPSVSGDAVDVQEGLLSESQIKSIISSKMKVK